MTQRILAIALLASMVSVYAADVALTEVKIIVAPGADPIQDGVIVIQDGLIKAVGPASEIPVPEHSRILRCAGATVLHSFYNSHVHFASPGWESDSTAAASDLTSQLETMFLRWGFTDVFDLGSVLQDTLKLRERIDSGEFAGPRILTTGMGFVKVNGTPAYVRDVVSLPEVSDLLEAESAVKRTLDQGADGIKVFTGSAGVSGPPMPVDLVLAMTDAAHRRGRLVFAHPQHKQGLENAISGGVDILAHAAPAAGDWSEETVHQMRNAKMALIPTLKLFRIEEARSEASAEQIDAVVGVAVDQVARYAKAGGEILFGTDVGFIDEFDPSEEYHLLERAGLDFVQILASLTTNPARRFSPGPGTGTIAVGRSADLVVVDGDPTEDLKAMAAVRDVFQRGQQVYTAR